MKPKVTTVVVSMLLFSGCNNVDDTRREDFEGHIRTKGAIAELASNRPAYGVFIKAAGGGRFETIHGPFSDLEACQSIAKAYNDGTFDARLPGVYICEPVSGALP